MLTSAILNEPTHSPSKKSGFFKIAGMGSKVLALPATETIQAATRSDNQDSSKDYKGIAHTLKATASLVYKDMRAQEESWLDWLHGIDDTVLNSFSSPLLDIEDSSVGSTGNSTDLSISMNVADDVSDMNSVGGSSTASINAKYITITENIPNPNLIKKRPVSFPHALVVLHLLIIYTCETALTLPTHYTYTASFCSLGYVSYY